MKEFRTEQEELAWFVGLVEGEGSFHISNGSPGFSLRMTDRDVMERTQLVLAAWGIPTNVRPYQHHQPKKDGTPRKLAWDIQICREVYLEHIIEMCIPYFSDKKYSDCNRLMDLINSKRKARINK